MYRIIFSLVLSRLDPENAHHLAFGVIRSLPRLGIGRLVARYTRPDASLAVTALGLRFPSPFGVAAGFDKDGRAIQGLGQLGFGHVEVGTVTAIAQPGNPSFPTARSSTAWDSTTPGRRMQRPASRASRRGSSGR
jgi:dihydroorotate dehydrogenase